MLCFFQSGPVLESHGGRHPIYVASATFCFFALGLAVMDLETMRLPNSFTRPGTALAVLIAAVRMPEWMDATLPHLMFNLGLTPANRLLFTHPHLKQSMQCSLPAVRFVGSGCDLDYSLDLFLF